MAFAEFLSGAGRLETAVLPSATSSASPLLCLTRGLSAVIPPSSGGGGGGATSSAPAAPAAAQLTLPDGRLNVGTHLPLLARRYKYLSSLGEGVSAQVILAEDTLAAAPGTLVAIKCLRRQHALAGQREARALRYLHAAAPGGVAPGVVRLLDSFMLGAHHCLVTERLYPWLLDWVAESSQLPQDEALASLRKIAHQLLMTVAFLHNLGLVCADIKPDNLLLCHPPGSHSVALRLVDFGGCFSLTETDTQAVGCEVQTLPYRAPEAAMGLPYGAAIDLWSVGVVLAEVALKRALLPCATPRDLLHQMVTLLGPLPEHMVRGSAAAQEMGLAALGGHAARQAARAPQTTLTRELEQRVAAAGVPELALPGPRRACQLRDELAAVDAGCADLVMRLLAYDPAQRLTAHQALLHPWFDAACPLRAVFPQLEELYRVQQAALRTEAGTTAAGAAAGAATPAPAKPAPAPAQPARAPLPVAGSPAAPSPLPGAVAAAAAAEAEAAEAAAVAAALPATVQRRWQAVLDPGTAHLLLGSQASKAGSGRQQQQAGERGQPWQALSAALAQPKPALSKLPAAQLAAQQWDQQQQLASRDPYAGAFSLEVTPPKGQAVVPAEPQRQQQQEQEPPSPLQPPQPPQPPQPLPLPPPPQQQQQPQATAAATVGDAAGERVPEAAPGADGAATGKRRGSKRGGPGTGGISKTPRRTSVKAAAQQQQQQQQQEAEEEQAKVFDLLLEAAAADSEEEERQGAPAVAGRSGSKPPRRKQQAGNVGSANAAGAGRGKAGAKPAAGAGAERGRGQAKKQLQQQRLPTPSVAASSGAVPAGKTPATARAIARQPAAGAGGKSSKKAQQQQPAVLSKVGEGRSAAQKRKPAADGAGGSQPAQLDGAAGIALTKQKAGIAQEPAAAGASPAAADAAPPATARKKQRTDAVHVAGAAEAAPPGTIARQRRETQQGNKVPWWVVRG
ncbi:hypothetical protein CHLNCDRAFT_51650 [Chlorella variabilis]|uniref:Protein kinase domain-containing protein n=1 Tax=Chlorella variabilis TaxID=554065 RepID=E1ZBI1_CHLVA|nr:hypothetical protein CHLNCDRAFT_51650 [Chlorella variabilis]EFN56857.1 hypothetical protein CHLNCDRAFT_51650 [Chlorella variabilis]|eukprot:XP_005848959.1 hypothetical protein CHLNCDRAFT_51650 [Chlorella variabilis]